MGSAVGGGSAGRISKKNMDAEPHSKQRRTTKRSKADESESEESSSAPELQNFPKFIIVIPTGSKTISDLSPFWIQKALQASIGTLTSVRKTQAGHLLIQRGHQMLRLKKPNKGRDCRWPALTGSNGLLSHHSKV